MDAQGAPPHAPYDFGGIEAKIFRNEQEDV
jgi:hypothetical protein